MKSTIVVHICQQREKQTKNIYK